MSSSIHRPLPAFKVFLFLLITCLCGLLLLSNDSLWIDEGESALKAIQPTLDMWWHHIRNERSSNLQLPFYLLYLWSWERILPSGEWWLRAANLPWYALAFYGLYLGLRNRPRLLPWLCAAFILNPFIYYYLNEARPYVILIAGGSFLAGCLAQLVLPDSENAPDPLRDSGFVRRAIFGSVLLVVTSIFGIVWAATFWGIVASVAGLSAFRTMISRHRFACLAATLISLAMGGYYAWTLHVGASPSAVGRTTPQTLLFAGYEHAGLAGLGPGRAELRKDGASLIRHYLPILAVAGTLIGTVLGAGLLAARRYRGALGRLLAFALVPAVFVGCVGLVKQFRVVGRHTAASNPVLLLLFALGLAALWDSRRPLRRAAAIGCLAAWAASIAFLRFAPINAKEDYRDAAALARNALARGERVWWVADDETGTYYHLPFPPATSVDGPLLNAANLREGTPSFETLPKPDRVIYSRGDIYDSDQRFIHYLTKEGYRVDQRLTAFTVWVKGS